MADRICTSNVSHTGLAGVGMPVSIACAATGGQPIRSIISGSCNTERNGGALPRIMARFCHSRLQHIATNSSAHSLFLVYFGTPIVWPSIHVRPSSLLCGPGTVVHAHLPPVVEVFGSLISVP